MILIVKGRQNRLFHKHDYLSAGNTELIIKKGPTSALTSLEVIRHPTNQQSLIHREHIAPIINGFHVSLRGTFNPSSHLAIAYAAFSYMGKSVFDDNKMQDDYLIPIKHVLRWFFKKKC